MSRPPVAPAPIEDDEAQAGDRSQEAYSRAGASAAAMLSALPFAAMGGAIALAPLVGLTGVLGAPWRRMHRALRAGGLTLALAAAFLGWVALTTLWSPKPDGAYIAGALAATAIGGALFALTTGRLPQADRKLALRAGAAGVFLLFAFAVVEARFDFPIGRALAPASGETEASSALFLGDAQRAVAISLMCAWGCFALLAPFGAKGAIAGAVLFGACLSLGAQFASPNNLIAFICGAPAALLALKWPRATISIVAQLLAAWLVVSPLLMPVLANLAASGLKPEAGGEPPFEWQARVESWTYIAGAIRERLFEGWGFGAAGHFGDTYTLLGFTLPYVPRHPHNGPLQIWLETGAIGAILAAGALASFGRRAGAALAEDRLTAAGAAGALVTAMVLANVSAGAWSLWWWAAAAVCVALLRLARRSP